ncbi:ABC transporter permease [Mesorhizobium sp. B2-9-1]|uniref:ABC transporter permease n=1 Tax=unclassified Mesorhizobium TaxID=325217 RepID=UPI00112ABF0E|nr:MULTISPECIES: ABC transporter permease [unclassified Mesorhizobium]TPI47393.1 ABC transporter permease [Mesorhizobium sp. B2-9-1]TPJ23543.1 ABC transporter permease [Mesorhizobium sp. B2-7-2]
MSALLAWLLTNPTILAIAAGLVGAIGWGFSQRLAGARAERSKQADAEVAARDVADQVDNDVGALPADAVRKELKSWARD